MEKELYLGLNLSGIKKDKSSLLVLEKYKDHNKVVLSNIEDKFKNSKLNFYPDEILKKQILSYKGVNQNIKAVGVNFPLFAPPCIGCRRECPGVQSCEVTEVKWLVREYKKANKLSSKSIKDRKIPSPYSERALDYYIANLLEEKFPLEPAFGSSRSSFYGRGQFLIRGLKGVKFIETFPKVSIWRLGLRYGLRKSVLRNFYRSEVTEDNRALFLEKIEKDFFIYEDDKENLIKNKGNFEALLNALSLYFFFNKQGEDILPTVLKKGQKVAVPG